MNHLGKRIVRKALLLKERFERELLRKEFTSDDLSKRLRRDVRDMFRRSGSHYQLYDTWSGEAPVDPRTRGDRPPRPANSLLPLLDRRISLLGKEIRLEEDIDWHREPFFGVTWPKRYVGALGVVRPGTDAVLLWHLNKMLFLLDASDAYRETGDRRFAELWVEWVTSWARQNPYMVGMNWRSPLETATRIVVWTIGLRSIDARSSMSESELSLILGSLVRQAEFVAGNFSYRKIPNNHLIGEAAALYFIAMMWPVLESAKEWRNRSEEVLLGELKRQVLADGMDFENAFNYHAYVLDFYLLYLYAKTIGDSAPEPDLLDGVGKLAKTFLTAISPAGRIPRFGDDSVTEFFLLKSLFELETMSPSDKLGMGDVVKPDFAGALRESPWGRAVLDLRVPLDIDAHLDRAGFGIFRRRGSHLVVSAGPLHDGEFSHGHLHSDGGSFELEVAGEPVFIDAGTYLYNYDPAVRCHFKGARAHNTVLVDGREPMESAATFDWKDVPRGRSLFLGGVDGCTGMVSARMLPSGEGEYQHRRVVLQLRNCAWIVADHLASRGGDPDNNGGGRGAGSERGDHVATILFHTPFPASRFVAESRNEIALSVPRRRQPVGSGAGRDDPENPNRLVFTGTASCHHVIDLLSDPNNKLTWYSPCYGNLRHGTTIRTSSRFDGSVCAVHALVQEGHSVVFDAIDSNGAKIAIHREGGAVDRLDIRFRPPAIEWNGRIVVRDF